MKDQQQGFTLLEVLIAVMLSSLVLLVLFSGMNTIQGGWAQSQRLHNELGDIKIVDRFMRGRLGDILFLSEEGTMETVFDGKANSISYLAPMMTYVGYPGIYKQTLKMQDGKLIFEWKSYRKESEKNVGDESKRVLLEDISDLKIDYYGSTESGNSDAVWNSSWDIHNGPPRMIRIQYKYHKDDVPEIVVPLVWWW